MSEVIYSAGLMSQSFWFIEFKKIVKLVHEGKSADDIKKLCLEENLFGAAKEYRAKRMYQYIINRVNTMDAELIALFMESDIATQKLINLITVLRLDRLYLEFVYEVYREKVLLGADQLTGSDVMVFFKNKGMQSELVEDWNESTKKHLRSNYLNFMLDANLLSGDKNKRSITPPTWISGKKTRATPKKDRLSTAVCVPGLMVESYVRI